LKSLLDGYEYLSYDARMKSKVSDVEPESIDKIVIIDIENNSIAPPDSGGLGRYQDWPHAYHGQLINAVTNSVKLSWTPDMVSSAIDYYQLYRYNSEDPEAELVLLDHIAYDSTTTMTGRKNWSGYDFFVQHVDLDGSEGQIFPIDTLTLIEPRSLLFDIIFDPQDTIKWQLVYDLAVSNWPADEWLSARTEDYLLGSDPYNLQRRPERVIKLTTLLFLRVMIPPVSFTKWRQNLRGTTLPPGSDISLICRMNRRSSSLLPHGSGIHIFSC
jgi:hypothetical protein